jgi:uncharacterized membrane protein YqjE
MNDLSRDTIIYFSLITLEGVILGATIIFTNAQQITVWLVTAVCLILVSLIFGVWRQKISVEAGYQTHEWTTIRN